MHPLFLGAKHSTPHALHIQPEASAPGCAITQAKKQALFTDVYLVEAIPAAGSANLCERQHLPPTAAPGQLHDGALHVAPDGRGAEDLNGEAICTLHAGPRGDDGSKLQLARHGVACRDVDSKRSATSRGSRASGRVEQGGELCLCCGDWIAGRAESDTDAHIVDTSGGAGDRGNVVWLDGAGDGGPGSTRREGCCNVEDGVGREGAETPVAGGRGEVSEKDVDARVDE